MTQNLDSEILSFIGEFALNTKGAMSMDTETEGAPMIRINITQDIMQECIDFVKRKVKKADENRIIEIINNVDLQNEIYDSVLQKDLTNFMKFCK